MSNAGDLLADARLLAEAGSFPRAHALATLACEELGKESACLGAMWSVFTNPKRFWNSFSSHTEKLHHAQVYFILRSGEPVVSHEVVNQRIRRESRSAHERKLRGLYVDYADDRLQLPSEITEDEARELIEQAQTELERSKSSWAGRVAYAEQMSEKTEIFRVVWALFVGWAVDAETDRVTASLRDGRSSEDLIELMPRFQQEVEAAGGLAAFAEELGQRY